VQVWSGVWLVRTAAVLLGKSSLTHTLTSCTQPDHSAQKPLQIQLEERTTRLGLRTRERTRRRLQTARRLTHIPAALARPGHVASAIAAAADGCSRAVFLAADGGKLLH
jgi:hypothetical protein